MTGNNFEAVARRDSTSVLSFASVPLVKLKLGAQLIYLDPGFMSLAYEEILGEPTPTLITRSRDLSSGISAGFAKADVASREVREYPMSAFQMFQKIRGALDELPTLDLNSHTEWPELFWTTGYLGVGAHGPASNSPDKEEFNHFSISGHEQGGNYIDLVTADSFFLPGFDQFAIAKKFLGIDMWRKVNALVRFLAANPLHKELVVCAPMVISRSE